MSSVASLHIHKEDEDEEKEGRGDDPSAYLQGLALNGQPLKDSSVVHHYQYPEINHMLAGANMFVPLVASTLLLLLLSLYLSFFWSFFFKGLPSAST